VLRRWRPVIPSGGIGSPGRRVRLLALLACRNEMRYLPGYLATVARHADGIVALDDGSTDGSPEFLATRPEVVELLRVSPDRPRWDEVGNHRRLLAAALRHRADWLVCVDADERLERAFRDRAERVIRRGRLLGYTAFAVRLRELWGSSTTYRSDGPWGSRIRLRLFRARADHQLDETPLHGIKSPLQARWALADLELYHLRMIRAEDRWARRRRYELLDPACRWQPGAYAYLTDESGLVVRPISPSRGFLE
jgi:glycosyltransferase involved in cell wall biosynthesis